MAGASPKKPGAFGDLTATEIKLLLASTLCVSGGKMDTEKLGNLTDMKRKSAASRFPTVKRKIEKLFEDKLANLDNEGDTNDSPLKPKIPTKAGVKRRRKAVATEAEEPHPEADQSETELATKDELGPKDDITIEGAADTPIKLEPDLSDDNNEEEEFKIKTEPIDE